MIATTKKMLEAIRVAELAGTQWERGRYIDLPLLVTGESGTGKGALVELIDAAFRSGQVGPYCLINLAAIAETVAESELFGHAAGAFTGAARSRPGLVEGVDGRMIFIDEVGKASLALQGKLLELVESRTYRRVGANDRRCVYGPIVLAASEDLAAEVEAGRFRRDLWYRIRRNRIHLPALRDRRADIEPLARHFAARCGCQLGTGVIQWLCAREWSGNARDIKTFVEAAGLRSLDDVVTLQVCAGLALEPMPRGILTPLHPTRAAQVEAIKAHLASTGQIQISRRGIEKLCDVSSTTAGRIVGQMIELGLLEGRGISGKRFYILSGSTTGRPVVDHGENT